MSPAPGATPIVVELNGIARELPPAATVEDVVALVHPSGRGCAVALNGEVVTRSSWTTTRLVPGDRCEILTAAPGG